MKTLNISGICLTALVFTVVAFTCLPREISGENIVAGCKRCKYAASRSCGSLPDKKCYARRNKCIGTSKTKWCWSDLTGASDCAGDKTNCKGGKDEFCG